MKSLQSVIVIIAIVWVAATAAQAQRRGEVILTDGSRIVGTVISLDQGVYQIQSDTLGIVRIEESKIQSFRYESGPDDQTETVPGLTGALQGSHANAMAQAIVNNDALFQMVMALQNDPDVQAVLTDPELKKAIDAGDMASLMGNPAFLKLLENEQVKRIQQRILSGGAAK